MSGTLKALLGACLLSLLGASAARAQVEDTIPTERSFESSQYFALELRGGPYTPDLGDGALNDAFDTFFKDDDDGFMWELEFDVIAFEYADFFDIGIGGLIGRAHYGGASLEQGAFDSGSSVETDEDSDLRLIPMAGLLVLRIDALPRKLNVPFILAAKLGYQWTHFVADDGQPTEMRGISHGLRWALQLALDLDVFEPSQARMMDEEWGINHSFLFFEYYGFHPSSDSAEVGARTWSTGLGFNF